MVKESPHRRERETTTNILSDLDELRSRSIGVKFRMLITRYLAICSKCDSGEPLSQRAIWSLTLISTYHIIRLFKFACVDGL